MATPTELIAYVRSQSLVETDDLTTERVLTVLNRGYQELSAARGWPWAFTSDSVSVTAGNKRVTLPADYMFMGWLEDSDEYEVNGWWVDLPAGELVFREDPTDTETMTLYYFQSVAALDTSGNAPPVFASQFHFALAEYALWKIHQREELYRRADVHRMEWMAMIEDMTRFYNQVTTGDVKFQIGQHDVQPSTGNLPFLHA